MLHAYSAALARGRRPQVISASLGICEPLALSTMGVSGIKAIERILQTAAGSGVSVLASAGVWAGNMAGDFGGWTGLSLRLLVPVAMLLIGFGAIYTWQQNQRAAEVEEIDAQLLTGDLPIDAYLDRGFQNYLKTRAAEE